MRKHLATIERTPSISFLGALGETNIDGVCRVWKKIREHIDTYEGTLCRMVSPHQTTLPHHYLTSPVHLVSPLKDPELTHVRHQIDIFCNKEVFTPGIHNDTQAIQLRVEKWTWKHGLYTDYLAKDSSETETKYVHVKRTFRGFKEMKFGWLGGFCYRTKTFTDRYLSPGYVRIAQEHHPDESPEQLQEQLQALPSMYITALFKHDDRVDDPSDPLSTDVDALEKANKRLLKIANSEIPELKTKKGIEATRLATEEVNNNRTLSKAEKLERTRFSTKEIAFADTIRLIKEFVFDRLRHDGVAEANLEQEYVKDVQPFIQSLTSYLKSTEWEARNRTIDLCPSEEAYKENRRDTGAFFNVIDLAFLLIGNPQARNNSTDFSRMCNDACDDIGFAANDLVSAGKELKASAKEMLSRDPGSEVLFWENLLFIYLHENEDASVKDAIKYLLKNHHAFMESFSENIKAYMTDHQEKLESKKRTESETTSPDRIAEIERIERAIESAELVRDWVIGNIAWSMVTGRYSEDSRSHPERALQLALEYTGYDTSAYKFYNIFVLKYFEVYKASNPEPALDTEKAMWKEQFLEYLVIQALQLPKKFPKSAEEVSQHLARSIFNNPKERLKEVDLYKRGITGFVAGKIFDSFSPEGLEPQELVLSA